MTEEFGLIETIGGVELEASNFRWNIEPHPYDSSFDVFVTNDDKEALKAIEDAAELYLWDGIEPGQQRTLKVTLNKI